MKGLDLVESNETMSSTQLAEILGYEKKEVNKKVRAMFGEEKARESFSPAYDQQRRVVDYHLPELESKMFVAKHDINYLEQVIQFWIGRNSPNIKALQIKKQEAIELIKGDLIVADLFNVPKNLAIIETVKTTKIATGVDYSNMAKLSLNMDTVTDKEIYLEPTEIGKKYGLSGRLMNIELMNLGLQLRNNAFEWEVTELGAKIATEHQWVKGNKSGYNYKWNVKEIDKLMKSS